MPDYPYYQLAQEQMDGYGGVVSFEVNGDTETAQRFINCLQKIKIAVSLGDVESLIQHLATMTHACIPEQERIQMGIYNSLVRLSVGLEDVQEIQEDISQALSSR